METDSVAGKRVNYGHWHDGRYGDICSENFWFERVMYIC